MPARTNNSMPKDVSAAAGVTSVNSDHVSTAVRHDDHQT
jgi:hypothetical protein